MFGHAGQRVDVDRHAAGQHQLVVVEHAGPFRPVVQLPPVEVDVRDRGHAEARALDDLSDRGHHVPWQHRGAHHLGQQRIVGDAIFLAQ